jgi:transporter family protein
MSAAPQTWLAWAIASAVFAALTAIFAKVGVSGVDPDVATAIRTVLIVAALAAYLWLAGKTLQVGQLSARTWTFLALSACATGASWLCYFRALQAGSASKVAPVDKLSVVLVAVFAFAFLGERPSPRDWAGIALVGLGAVVLALP